MKNFHFYTVLTLFHLPDISEEPQKYNKLENDVGLVLGFPYKSNLTLAPSSCIQSISLHHEEGPTISWHQLYQAGY